MSTLEHPEGAKPPFPGVPPSERDLRAAAVANSIYYQGGKFTAITRVLDENPVLLALVWMLALTTAHVLGIDTPHLVAKGLGFSSVPPNVDAVLSSTWTRFACNGAISSAVLATARFAIKRSSRPPHPQAAPSLP